MGGLAPSWSVRRQLLIMDSITRESSPVIYPESGHSSPLHEDMLCLDVHADLPWIQAFSQALRSTGGVSPWSSFTVSEALVAVFFRCPVCQGLPSGSPLAAPRCPVSCGSGSALLRSRSRRSQWAGWWVRRG